MKSAADFCVHPMALLTRCHLSVLYRQITAPSIGQTVLIMTGQTAPYLGQIMPLVAGLTISLTVGQT
uniref:Uncharacterized protein n=1 Tax=Oryza glumipatula TaxID=40148 RepID=A0A0E0BNF0_9ORYZ